MLEASKSGLRFYIWIVDVIFKGRLNITQNPVADYELN